MTKPKDPQQTPSIRHAPEPYDQPSLDTVGKRFRLNEWTDFWRKHSRGWRLP